MASNNIVQVAVTQIAAPIPDTLQQTGAIISVGSTTLSPGASQVLTQVSDLTSILAGALPLSGITYSGGTAVATTMNPHGYPIGDEISLTIAGAIPTAYNGTFDCLITGASTFIYAPLTNPGGSASTPGGYTPQQVNELIAMVTTFFAQGNQVAPFVLELGALDTDDAIAALTAYLVANPNSDYEPGDSGFYYVYLLPSAFDGHPGLTSLLTTYDGTAAITYFVVTSSLATYKNYTDLMKDAIVVIPTPQLANIQQTAVNSVTNTGFAAEAAAIAVSGSGSQSYVPGTSILTAVGGTGTGPTFNVTDTVVRTVTQNAGGSGTGSGAATFTGTTGTGTRVTGTCTVSSGVMSAPVITNGGDYTVNPTLLTAEPVTVTGVGITCTGATVGLVMGVLEVSIATAGNMTVIPANPVATTVSPSGPTGATLNIDWTDEGLASATLASNPHIAVGQWFQLTGFSPAAWNGYWQAGVGTTGTTLNFAVPDNQPAVVSPGFVAGNTAVSAGPGATEFQAAGVFYDILATNPSSSNRAAPFSFRFQFGVTPWPKQGLGALQLTLKEASVNIIRTGAEGGISTAALYWGTTMDGRGILYWYSVDWININGHVAVANEVINGSNDPTNPLFYDQPGIDRLQDRLGQEVVAAVSNGLATGQVVKTALTGVALDAQIALGTYNGQLVVNAVPFLDYAAANPSDFRSGTYNGLSVRYITTQGFTSILINISVTDFIVQG